MCYYTYILKSGVTGGYYYGHCRDPENRLRQHNSGKVRSTKSKRPWRVIYIEVFESKSLAYKRELFFKSIDGYRFLKESGIK
jgi:putative endonuclease